MGDRRGDVRERWSDTGLLDYCERFLAEYEQRRDGEDGGTPGIGARDEPAAGQVRDVGGDEDPVADTDVFDLRPAAIEPDADRDPARDPDRDVDRDPECDLDRDPDCDLDRDVDRDVDRGADRDFVNGDSVDVSLPAWDVRSSWVRDQQPHGEWRLEGRGRGRWIIGGAAAVAAGSVAFVTVLALGPGGAGTGDVSDTTPTAVPSAVAAVPGDAESAATESEVAATPAESAPASDSADQWTPPDTYQPYSYQGNGYQGNGYQGNGYQGNGYQGSEPEQPGGASSAVDPAPPSERPEDPPSGYPSQSSGTQTTPPAGSSTSAAEPQQPTP